MSRPPTKALGTTPHPPPDAIALVLEQMALINARMDVEATEIVAQRQGDAQRDNPRPVQAPTRVEFPPQHHPRHSVTTTPPPHHTSLHDNRTTHTPLVVTRPCTVGHNPSMAILRCRVASLAFSVASPSL
jgi:hypothetical protein